MFGNGLGRALDPDFFDLGRAMSSVYASLDKPTRRAIGDCLPAGKLKPTSEDDFDKLHRASVSCETLVRIIKPNSWLTDQGLSFPDQVASFSTKIAASFHNCNRSLPEPFIDSSVII